MTRVESAHTFGRGLGIAAPQIGIGRAAALVRTPAQETITLINPVVIEETPGDEQYEGCLSFFDVRGIVNRPLCIHVEHQDLDGQRRITDFDRGTARQVAHESDHLNGVLYTHRMDPGREPIPVSEYRQGGQDWIAHGQPAVEQLDRRITRAEHRVAELETHAGVRRRWLAERSSL